MGNATIYFHGDDGDDILANELCCKICTTRVIYTNFFWL